MAVRAKPTGVRVENSHGPDYEVLGLNFPSPLFKSRAAAEAWMAATVAKLPATKQARQRACLTCGHSFLSDGAHNRMCDPCRGSARADTGIFAIARGSRSNFRAGAR